MEIDFLSSMLTESLAIQLEKPARNQSFGIAISGGSDSPDPDTGDTNVRISDVISGSPAEGKLLIGDIVEAVNGVSVVNVPHLFAVELLKNAQKFVFLRIRRQIYNNWPSEITRTQDGAKRTSITPTSHTTQVNIIESKFTNETHTTTHYSPCKTQIANDDTSCIAKILRTSLSSPTKEYGLFLSNVVYVSAIQPDSPASFANIKVGDIIFKINDRNVSNLIDANSMLSLKKESFSSIDVDLLRIGQKWWPDFEENKILTQQHSFSDRTCNTVTPVVHNDIKSEKRPISAPIAESPLSSTPIPPIEKKSIPIVQENQPINVPKARCVRDSIKALINKYENQMTNQVKYLDRSVSSSNVTSKPSLSSSPPVEIPKNLTKSYSSTFKTNDTIKNGQQDYLFYSKPAFETGAKEKPAEFTQIGSLYNSSNQTEIASNKNDYLPIPAHVPGKIDPKKTELPTEQTKNSSGNFEKSSSQVYSNVNLKPSDSSFPVYRSRASLLNDLSLYSSNKSPSPNPQTGTQETSNNSSNSEKCYPLRRSNSIWDLSGSKIVNVVVQESDQNIGIQIIGGSLNGVFVSAILPGSPADKAGIQEADQLFSVDDINFQNQTREFVVLELLKLESGTHKFTLKSKRESYEKIRYQHGDSFFIRVNFSYSMPVSPKELTFAHGDIFHVRDTMYGGIIGSWFATRIGKDMKHLDSGVIPNESRAQQLVIKEQAQRRSFRKYPKRSSFRSSLSSISKMSHSQDNLDAISFDAASLDMPAYEVVTSEKATFPRPVVFLGACSDILRKYLIDKFSDKFTLPLFDKIGKSSTNVGPDKDDFNDVPSESEPVVTLWEIQRVINTNHHCLLDITQEGIDILNRAHIPPIVILIKVSSRSYAKELRSNLLYLLYKGAQPELLNTKHPSRMYTFGIRFQRNFSHLINEVLEVKPNEDSFIIKNLLKMIDNQQQSSLWLPKSKSHSNNRYMESGKLKIRNHNLPTSNYFSDESEDDDQSRYNDSETHETSFNDDVEPLPHSHDQAEENIYRTNITKDSHFSPRKQNIEIQNNPQLNYYGKIEPYDIPKKPTLDLPSSFITENSKSPVFLPSSDVKEIKINRITTKGGLIESQCRSISLFIPPGSISSEQEFYDIFFRAYLTILQKDQNAFRKKCRKILIGPRGAKFNKPVELRFPFSLAENDVLEIRTIDNPKDATDRSSILTVLGRQNISGLIQLDSNTSAILLESF